MADYTAPSDHDGSEQLEQIGGRTAMETNRDHFVAPDDRPDLIPTSGGALPQGSEDADHSANDPAFEKQAVVHERAATDIGEPRPDRVVPASGSGQSYVDEQSAAVLASPDAEGQDEYAVVDHPSEPSDDQWLAAETLADSGPTSLRHGLGQAEADGPPAATAGDDNYTRWQIDQRIKDNSGIVVGVLQQTVRRMVDSHQLPVRYVESCVAAFVKPQNIESAKEKLRARVAVLVGEPGTGCHTSAVWLLRGVNGITLREVRREPRDNFVPDDLRTERGTGWLLDLRGDDDQVADNFGRAVLGSRDPLDEVDSYLVVAIRPALWERVGAGGEEVAVHLVRPSATEIVRRRLTQEGSTEAMPEADAIRWLEYPEIAGRIANLPPAEAAGWAETIRREHFTPPEQNEESGPVLVDSDELMRIKVNNVIKAQSNWRADLRDWHKTHEDSRWRNFLLAAAVLENAPASEVFLAAESLAHTFGEPAPRSPGQTGPGILQLTFDAHADLPDGETIQFHRTGYADAVLEYFWSDRMHLREDFTAWMSKLPLKYEGAFAESVVDRIGQYVLRWCAHNRKLDLLKKVVTAWADHQKLAPTATTLLTAAALDPTLGRATRDQMLDWAKADGSSRIKSVVAHACGGALGSVYPKMMLLRLGHLARTGDPQVADSVKSAVRSLWQLPDLRDRIRSEIGDWCTAADPARREAGRRTFNALAQLVDDNSVPLLLAVVSRTLTHGERLFLVRGWRTILDAPRSTDEAVAATKLWMESAVHSSAISSTVVEVLETAVHEPDSVEDFSGTRQVSLTRLLYSWQPAGAADGRALLRDTIIERCATHDPVRHAPDRRNGTHGAHPDA